MALRDETGTVRVQRPSSRRRTTGGSVAKHDIAYDAAMLVLQAVGDADKDLRHDSTQEWDPRSTSPATVYLKIIQQSRETPEVYHCGPILGNGDSSPACQKS